MLFTLTRKSYTFARTCNSFVVESIVRYRLPVQCCMSDVAGRIGLFMSDAAGRIGLFMSFVAGRIGLFGLNTDENNSFVKQNSSLCKLVL